MTIENRSEAGRAQRPALDEVSKAIIATLQTDGRTPYATIARSVGLSEAAVRQRVQRLQESGVLQIVAVTDPAQVGFARQAMVGITVAGSIAQVREDLQALPELSYLVVTTGRFDLLAEVVCVDDEHLLDLLTERIRAVPGVADTESFIYLKIATERYDWGTR